MLEEKTRGNLTAEERQLLDQVLFELRMRFVEAQEEPAPPEPDHPALTARVTFLGTGTSHGVPMIGCPCDTCHSTDPRDRRLRPSIYVDVAGGPSVLVDTATDLRQQALTHRVTRVDAILFTHSHADHVMGLDEVRRFNMMQRRRDSRLRRRADRRRICGGRSATSSIRRRRRAAASRRSSCTTIDGPFAIDGSRVVPGPALARRSVRSSAFASASFAYLTDCNRIPDESWPLLRGSRRARARRAAPSAASDALHRGARRWRSSTASKPRHTYFTHICHDLPHEATNARCPPASNSPTTA